ncbi:MAG: 4Fe-4S binding protein [Thermoleophilia bacterium]|jgi:pyruvate ferredoxin oxidoreductase delta subunit|nr:4Fe-4S binding protein [Actinomycetota bacterium]MCL6093832.1 4Fe-4S binding protein [Actinomycetota bacterium]MDA8167768.1 4Fe-4S binding protein [Actinomycetota bacterium]
MSKKWNFEDIATWGPGRHEPGATIPDSGTADEYETGGWRTDRPVRDREKCNDCMICFFGCPDSAIIVEEGRMAAIDLRHCKGCGICAQVCPRDAIEMRNEIEARKEEEEEE